MKVIVSLDSFKGCITSLQAAEAVKEGIEQAVNADISIYTISDGGEGFVESYCEKKNVKYKVLQVHDSMHRICTCSYAILDNKTAIIEVSSMCGITKINLNNEDIRRASTLGLGEVILDALDEGCRNFIIGLGGSSVNDGGSGMLRALGYTFLDQNNKVIPYGVEGLSILAEIRDEEVDKRLKQCHFVVACDVENPMLGNNGCSFVFGQQKGASLELQSQMDKWLKHYASKINALYPCANPMQMGSGAAGGLGFALLSVLDAEFTSGISLILESSGIATEIEKCDIVVTGEGRMDAQSIMGKSCIGIAKLAKKYNKPVIALCGSIGEGAEKVNQYGIDAYFAIQKGPCSLNEALDHECTILNLSRMAKQLFRLWNI